MNIFIMNRYISKSYTRSKNTIYRAGAAVVSFITGHKYRKGGFAFSPRSIYILFLVLIVCQDLFLIALPIVFSRT